MSQVGERSAEHSLRTATESVFGSSFDLLARAPQGVARLRELVVRFASAGLLDDQEGSKVSSLLGSVAEFVMGQAPPGSACNKDGVGTVFVKTGEFGDLYPEAREWTTQPLKFAKLGDVLVCVVGATIGKLNLAIDSAIGRSVAAIRPGAHLTTKYLYYMLMPFTLSLRQGSRGSAQGVIGKSDLSSIRIRVPHLAEQEHIVARIEELMQLCDALEAHGQLQDEQHARLVATLFDALAASDSADALADNWQRIATHFDLLLDRPEAVDTLEQTLLQLAVRGLLVPQDPNGQLASVKWVKTANRGLTPPGDDETPFAIPRGWQWARLGWLAEFINGDRGKNYPNRAEYVPEGLPFINTGHIEPDGTLSSQSMNYLTRKKFESLRSGKTQVGDLVYCLRGATLGKTAMVDYTEGAIASSLVIIRLSDAVFRKYAYYYLVSPLGKSLIKRFDNGSAQPNLAATSVQRYVFPLPPLAEQHRIVARVEQLRVLCAQLRERLQQARTTQSHLADALVGAAAQSPAC